MKQCIAPFHCIPLSLTSSHLKDATHCAFLCVCASQELKEFLNRVGEVTFADAHKDHLNEG